MLSTDQKGAIAELAIATRAIELGIEVYRPVAEGGRYDLIHKADEIDGVAAYCHRLDRCFYLSIEEVAGRMAVQLRLEQTRNNQSQLVDWAADFGLERLQSTSSGP